jgi:hypothetical protein
MLSLDYIAGCIDCDGSISISSRNRDNSFNFVVNFRQLEYARPYLEEMQQILGAGKIYTHSGPGQKMLTWQTTTMEEARKVCQILIPYLKFKRRQAELVVKAIDIWESSKLGRKGAGFYHSQDAKDQIKVIAKSLNINNQTNTIRKK